MARTPFDEDGHEPPEAVGPGRPPVRHRIREGETRNPWGRRGKPKPPVDFLDEEVTLRIDGKPQRVKRRDALDHFLFGKAAKGDVRAIRLIEERARQRQTDPSDPVSTELSREEQTAFDRFIRRASQRLDEDEQP